MKHLLQALCILCVSGAGIPAMAWDGFDAATADLVEIIPDAIPKRGDTVEIHFYEGDRRMSCTVENIIRNSRTIEVMVRDPDNATRILVMEGR